MHAYFKYFGVCLICSIVLFGKTVDAGAEHMYEEKLKVPSAVCNRWLLHFLVMFLAF